MATTRLRKTFHYPADNSDEDDTPLELDEEEQEQLIEKLHKENEEQNAEYMRIFLVLPLISVMTYLPALLHFPSPSAKFISLLCITSLAATTYILFIPNMEPVPAKSKRATFQTESENGPLSQYLDKLNGGLSFLLALNAVIARSKPGVHEGFWILCVLPALVLGVVVVAKREMLSVDVDELKDLKYGYKGA